MKTLDKLKTWAAALIALVGIYLSTLELVTTPVPVRFAIFFATLGAAAAIMYFTEIGQQFIAYALAATVEVRKVVWPGREEVLKMTGVVLVFVCVVAIFLWLVDGLLGWLLGLLAQ